MVNGHQVDIGIGSHKSWFMLFMFRSCRVQGANLEAAVSLARSADFLDRQRNQGANYFLFSSVDFSDLIISLSSLIDI